MKISKEKKLNQYNRKQKQMEQKIEHKKSLISHLVFMLQKTM